MVMWTISKQRFIGVICIFFAIAVIIGLFFNKNTSASASTRKLPIYSVDTTEKKIAITFDAAWTNQDTNEIIEILKKHNAKATFFIVGDWAEKFPESVKAFFDAGHTIANHSDTHKAFSKCSREEIREEIINCNKKLEAITNTPVTLVRAPSGDYTDQSLDVCKELNMTMIQWSCDSIDYTKISTDEIVNRVIKGTTNGSIVLFHNGVENTAPALDKILTELETQGYSFVSVEDLIYKDNYYLDHTGRQHKNDA
ncbi:MAG: polysaccharide deacetylase family protein [Clostridia bacterium]|nr:polysaccharide deacetylase family protein [Clostridia bacterium]